MEPISGWVTVGQNPWHTIRTVLAIKRRHVIPKFYENGREPGYFETFWAGVDTLSMDGWISHVGTWFLRIKGHSVPAGWKREFRRQTIFARSETFGKPFGVC